VLELAIGRERGSPIRVCTGIPCDIHWSAELGGYRVQIPKGELVYIENFFGREVSDRAISYFQENDSFDWKSHCWRGVSHDHFQAIQFANIQWKQEYIGMYGRRIPLPRLTSLYADADLSYSYSGLVSTANEWNKGLLYLRERVESFAGHRFNSVLLNWYRDGKDGLSWHADDEPELGRNPIIASASFGSSRDFTLRMNHDHQLKLTLPLRHGSLLLMHGQIQHYWQHCVSKRKNVSASRFNLTFRRIERF